MNEIENEMRFHHVGIACRDIEASKRFYTGLGYSAGATVEDPIQRVKVCFLDKAGMPRLELLAPVDDKSPVNRTLATSGVTPYHICYEVSDIEACLSELKGRRFVCVSKPVAACAMGNKRVSFLYHKDVGLVELVEE